MRQFDESAAALRARYPEIETVEVFVTDLNGVPRGKLMPISSLSKLGKGAARMPVSAIGLDVFGADVGRSRIALEVGDPDGELEPAAHTLAPTTWTDRPSAHVIATVKTADGYAQIDPRAALLRVEEKARAMGLTPVVAAELEFYLIDTERDEKRRPQTPLNPITNARLYRSQIYDMNVMRAFENMLLEMSDACRACGAPADTAICEFGPGQFEINLIHTDSAVMAADYAIIMKRAIRGVARKHGYDVTFMAKPYGDAAGSGLHVHMSFLNEKGDNIFADGTDQPNDMLRWAVGGMLETMADGMAIYAPHYNSYRRFLRGSYAPLAAAWGIDNRGASIRLPETSGKGARFEHRVAGADANPYLVIAHILAGALHGIEKQIDPGPARTGEVQAREGGYLPRTWADAIDKFEASDFNGETFGPLLRRVYAAMKRQEQETLLARVTDAEYDTYLRTV